MEAQLSPTYSLTEVLAMLDQFEKEKDVLGVRALADLIIEEKLLYQGIERVVMHAHFNVVVQNLKIRKRGV
jgi:hypothetical protein